jgi:hypothetical protein
MSGAGRSASVPRMSRPPRHGNELPSRLAIASHLGDDASVDEVRCCCAVCTSASCLRAVDGGLALEPELRSDAIERLLENRAAPRLITECDAFPTKPGECSGCRLVLAEHVAHRAARLAE